MTALFSSPPKPKDPPKPSQESLDLQAAQTESLQKQTAALDRQEKTAKKEKKSRQRVVATRRGRRGLGTLFEETGELGVQQAGTTLGGRGK